MPDTAISLLRDAAIQFRYYEMQHRNKAFALHGDPAAQRDTLAKAVVNASLADQIEAFLNDDTSDTSAQGTLAYLPPKAS